MNENELVKQNLGLVIKIAKGFNPKNKTELEDFIQEGSIALLKSIRKHDPAKGKISTLAWKYITKALIRYKSKVRKNKEKQQVLDMYVDKEKEIALWEMIPNYLSETEIQVVSMRYHDYTFQEIGMKLGYTKSWAHKIFKTILDKIKKSNG